MTTVKLSIEIQGRVMADPGEEFLVLEQPEVLLLQIDLSTKHAEVAVLGSDCSISLRLGDHSVNFDPDNEGLTKLLVTPSEGKWDIFSAEVCGYALSVTLVRRTALGKYWEEHYGIATDVD